MADIFHTSGIRDREETSFTRPTDRFLGLFVVAAISAAFWTGLFLVVF